MATCPTCQATTAWHGGNAHRPFCSLRCRLIDLGFWLDGRYRIPTEPRDDDADLQRPSDVS